MSFRTAKPKIRLCAVLAITLCLQAADTDTWIASVQVGLDGKATMRTQSIRCMASLVYTLNKSFHLNVTYEDAPLIYTGDRVDVTASQNGITGQRQHVYIPRGGGLGFQYDADLSTHALVELRSALEEMLAAYRVAGYPGQYVVSEERNTLGIEPSGFRDVRGSNTAMTSVMNARVTVGLAASTSLERVIEVSLAAASAQSGRRIVVGAVLPHQFSTMVLGEQLTDVTARDAIRSAIETSGVKMSWLLLYDPTFDYYVFTPYVV